MENPKQRLIISHNGQYCKANEGLFVKTLSRASEIVKSRNKKFVSKAVFYDKEGKSNSL